MRYCNKEAQLFTVRAPDNSSIERLSRSGYPAREDNPVCIPQCKRYVGLRGEGPLYWQGFIVNFPASASFIPAFLPSRFALLNRFKVPLMKRFSIV
jgi:hypothetical protein